MAMKITVPEPDRTDFDDAFCADAYAADMTFPAFLAHQSPAPPDFIEAVKDRFLSRTPYYKPNVHTITSEDPLEQWAEGRAALAHQLAWYEQKSGNRLVTVADLYGPDSGIVSLFPAFVESEVQAGLIAEGLVPWLSMGTTVVNSQTVRATYDSSAENTRELRKVGPGGLLPGVKITLADSDIYLWKYGRMLEWAYEVIADQQLDTYGNHLRRIGMQMAVDETDLAMDTLVGGDGTTAGAAESDSTDVEVAGAGVILYSDMIGWVYNPSQPYHIDKAVGGATDLALVTNLAEVKAAARGIGVAPDLPMPTNVSYKRWDGGATGSAYVDRLIVGVDSRHALQKYTKGSLLQENDSLIDRQVRRWALSYWVGFRKFDNKAVHVLDTNTVL